MLIALLFICYSRILVACYLQNLEVTKQHCLTLPSQYVTLSLPFPFVFGFPFSCSQCCT